MKEHEAVVAQLNELTEQWLNKNDECDRLRKQVDEATRRFDRAKNVLDCLQSEMGRWDTAAVEATESLQCAPADCLLAAAGLAYSGVLNASFRSMLFEKWLRACTVPVRSSFDFTETLEEQMTVSVLFSRRILRCDCP